MKINEVNKFKIFIVFLSFLFVLLTITLFDVDFSGQKSVILFLSWVGLIEFIVFFFFWKNYNQSILCLQNLFNLMYLLFNFGQCLLWAFGIHIDKEIGNSIVFSSYYISYQTIIKAQLLFISSFCIFNLGLSCFCKANYQKYQYKSTLNNKRTLYCASVVILAFALPAAFFLAIYTLYLSQKYSYHDIYYGDINNISSIVILLAQMFPAALLGMLIGSGYKKRIVIVSYSLFGIYCIITLLSGDRGEWVLPFSFFVWAHFKYYRKLNTKKIIFFCLFGVIGLFVINAIVSLRNVGLSWQGFIDSLFSSENNALVSMVMEFGNSMGIVCILIQNSTTPMYGNTYLMTIPTIISTGLANGLFGFNYVQLHTWFPLEYLKISYGTDFSIIGEAFLNCGLFGMFVPLFVEGLLIGKFMSSAQNYSKNGLTHICSIIILMSVIKIFRSTVWFVCNKCIFPLIIYIIVYYAVDFFLKGQAGNSVYEKKIIS